MTAYARSFEDAEFIKPAERRSGKGVIISVDHKPVVVLYTFSRDRMTGTISVSGSSIRKKLALREMWLEPVVILQTEDHEYTDIAITDFSADGSLFEVVQDF